MSYNYLHKDPEKPIRVFRQQKPLYKRESVLSTDVFPMIRARDYEQTLQLIAAAHRDRWYLHYHFFSSDAAEAVSRVPSVIRQFNRSRVLRRAHISGARMCNLSQYQSMFYYVSDIVTSCSFDALVFASLLNTYKRFDSHCIVSFRSLMVEGRQRKRLLASRYDDLIEKFFRRSKLPRNSVHFSRCDDEYLLGEIRTKITTTKPLFDVINILCDVLGDDVQQINFGEHKHFTMSRSSTVDIDLYSVRPIDDMLNNFRYHKFSSFGLYANGQNIVNLNTSKL